MGYWQVKDFQTQSYIQAYVHTDREDREMIAGWRLTKVSQCTWDQFFLGAQLCRNHHFSLFKPSSLSVNKESSLNTSKQWA